MAAPDPPRKGKPAIIYLDDAGMMHDEWEEALGPMLRQFEITSLHCIGYSPDTHSAIGLKLLGSPTLLNQLSQYDVRLIVSDVRMPHSEKNSWLGGLHLVRQIALVLGESTPPILFASTRPERIAQEKLIKEMRLVLLGEVLIDVDNIRNSAHWDKIRAHIVKSFDLREGNGVLISPYDVDESIVISGFKVYRDIVVESTGKKARLQSWSSRTIVFQLLARTPKKTWSTEEIIDLLYTNRQKLSEVSPIWDVLEDRDMRPQVAQRLRNCVDALLKKFPGTFYKVDDGNHLIQGLVSWNE